MSLFIFGLALVWLAVQTNRYLLALATTATLLATGCISIWLMPGSFIPVAAGMAISCYGFLKCYA